jgi:hypothetical protein
MPACPQCQLSNPPGAAACARCGTDLRGGGAFAYTAAAGGQRKGLAIASLVLGLLSLPTLGILGVGALAAIVLGIVALVKAGRSPAEFGGKGMAIGGIVCAALSLILIPFIGIIAAIAIPGLLRARTSANESATIGDIRSVISAEVAYAASNGGFYGTLECLATPSRCIADYPASAPTFLTGPIEPVKSGYTRTFHAGPPAPSLGQPVAPGSMMSFAYVAVPTTRNQTGVRGFCGDATGRICFTPDGSAPEVVNGECSPLCTTLN